MLTYFVLLQAGIVQEAEWEIYNSLLSFGGFWETPISVFPVSLTLLTIPSFLSLIIIYYWSCPLCVG